jgi:hypothetical protein
LFGGGCGRYFHWSRLFKTLVSDCRQNLKKSGGVAFFRGELQE